jgi:hypothetical protein
VEKNVLAELEHYMNATSPTLGRKKRRQVEPRRAGMVLEPSFRIGRVGIWQSRPSRKPGSMYLDYNQSIREISV